MPKIFTLARYLGALTRAEERQRKEEVRDRHFWKRACNFSSRNVSSIVCALQNLQTITSCLLWSIGVKSKVSPSAGVPGKCGFSPAWVTFLWSLWGLSMGIRKARFVKYEMCSSEQQEKGMTSEILIICLRWTSLKMPLSSSPFSSIQPRASSPCL